MTPAPVKKTHVPHRSKLEMEDPFVLDRFPSVKEAQIWNIGFSRTYKANPNLQAPVKKTHILHRPFILNLSFL